MDAISTSTKLIWIFGLIYTYPILLFFFSVSIWFHNEFKRLAFVSYIADIILTGVIFFGSIDNLVSRIIRENPISHWNIPVLIVSAISIILSISSYRKNKKVSNISMNVATALCMIVIINQINI